jgi:diacylglycerol kinase (ATP)
MKQGLAGLLRRRFINASEYSWQGLRSCFQHEEAFRFELFLGVLLFPLAFMIADSIIQLCLLLGSMLIVLIVELLNSAVEAVVDLIGTEYHELAGRAKDQGSAAVLLSMILFLLIWGTLGWAYAVA